MIRKTTFVTNVNEYAGPPTAAAMAKAGWDVFCHDDSFESAELRAKFERENPGCFAASTVDPANFVAEGFERFGRIDALVSNDIPKDKLSGLPHRTAKSFFGVGDLLQDFEAHIDSMIIEPVRLLRAALPVMKAARSGSIIFITSGAPLRVPSTGPPHGYTAARAAANMLAQTLSCELAPLNIQVNAVAPFLVYSQTFFPSAVGVDDPQYTPTIDRLVPMRRFGRPEEIGSLIALLASGDARFVSGQVIAFSGAGC